MNLANLQNHLNCLGSIPISQIIEISDLGHRSSFANEFNVSTLSSPFQVSTSQKFEKCQDHHFGG